MENKENWERCPAWCVVEHDDEDQLADRWHRSQMVMVPVVERGHLSTDDSLVMVETMVVLEQHVLDSEPWVTFGPGEEAARCFTVSWESAGRIIRGLSEVLAGTVE